MNMLHKYVDSFTFLCGLNKIKKKSQRYRTAK